MMKVELEAERCKQASCMHPGTSYTCNSYLVSYNIQATRAREQGRIDNLRSCSWHWCFTFSTQSSERSRDTTHSHKRGKPHRPRSRGPATSRACGVILPRDMDQLMDVRSFVFAKPPSGRAHTSLRGYGNIVCRFAAKLVLRSGMQ